MECRRCGNQDMGYFFLDQSVWYCRKCIQFGRLNVGEELMVPTYLCKRHRCRYHLDYPLTKAQLKAASQLVEEIKDKHNVLLYAACGSGKTEIVMEVLQYALNKGMKVGFAISRRQVVLEIQERLSKAFPTLHIIAVCEGYTDIVDGDLIVCTMHQLYRYHQTFDLLIMDEVDAFPYKHNVLLEHIAMNAAKGNIIYLTATPDEAMLQQVRENHLSMVTLYQRPHGYPLIVPKLIKCLPMFQLMVAVYYLERWMKIKKPILVFVPSIAFGQTLYQWLRFRYRCGILTSKTDHKDEIISDMRNRKLQFLITTTILERGVTFDDVQVIIMRADHPVFDEASLIQIIGRVGRNIHHPTGEGVFLYTRQSLAITRCLDALNKMNETV